MRMPSHSKPHLQSLPTNSVNYLFDELISSRFTNYLLIFTDGSVFTNSAGFSFYIPSLNINFSDNLPSKACSFTTESYAILSALEFVKSLNVINVLIISDSLSVLSSLASVPFKKSRSFLTIKIKALIHSLHSMDINVEFLWCPSHVGILGNEVADHLAKLTNSFNRPPILKIPSSDLLSSFRLTIYMAWQDKWSNFSLANWHKSIVPIIPKHPWFYNLPLSRFQISSFSRLRFGHNRLPFHAFNMSLNHSPFCPKHNDEVPCNFSHLLFDCPALQHNRLLLFNFLSSLNISPINSYNILNTKSSSVIIQIISFIHAAGFVI